MVGVRVKIDTFPLRKFEQSLSTRQLSPILGRMYFRVAAVYASYARRRFVQYSRGGGDWPPLSRATLAARRSGAGTTDTITVRGKQRRIRFGSAAILRDTGQLFRGLTIGASDNYLTVRPRGVVYGFKDNKHGGAFASLFGRLRARVTARGRRKPTVREIAVFHQRGGKRLPRRVILAQPDTQTRQQMSGAVGMAIREAMRAAGRAKA